jgi:hypothetical protein
VIAANTATSSRVFNDGPVANKSFMAKPQASKKKPGSISGFSLFQSMPCPLYNILAVIRPELAKPKALFQ